jgi:hypothetical protein
MSHLLFLPTLLLKGILLENILSWSLIKNECTTHKGGSFLLWFNWHSALQTLGKEPTIVLNENVPVWYLLTTERTAAEWGWLSGHGVIGSLSV